MIINKKMLTFFVFICACAVTCNCSLTSRKKCEEYGNLVKSSPCIESSGTRGPAKSGDFPHMALIGYPYKNGEKIRWSCAGVLISDQYVLTPAHCVQDKNPTVIRFGELNIKIEEDNTHIQDIKISNIIKHPDYNKDFLYNDIALIKIEKPVQINQYVRPACLPDANEVINYTNQKYIKSGWGLLPKENVESKPYLLYNRNINTVSYETCKKSYLNLSQLPKGLNASIHLCIGQNEEECQLISGSAIQLKDKYVGCMHKIIGLLDFAHHNCDNTPEVSTTVSAYVDWIEKNVWA